MIESGTILRVVVVGEGPYVIAQSPQAGTKVPQGSVVRLYLGPTPAGSS